MKFLIWAAAILLSQAAFAADLFLKQQPRPFKLADPVEVDATIGGYPIWKGDGTWRLADLVRRDVTSNRGDNTPIGDATFFQITEKRLVAVMTISANLGGSNTRWLGEPCKRDDMLYKANIGNGVWEDNCVTLNHLTNYMGNPSGKSAEAYALFKEQGVDIPPTVLSLDFTRNGTRGNFLHITVKVNPEAFGLPRESEINWGRNPWNKTMSFNDPAKKQLIDALGIWGLAFAKQMDAALDQKQNAFDAIPSLRTILIGQPKPIIPKTTVRLD